MSLVLGYANRDNAIIMSDGRAGENGCFSENYNKTMKISENVIIGFTGIKERIETFIPHVLKEMGVERGRYFIEDFLEIIDFYMKDKETQKHLESSFIIIGRRRKNGMISSIVGDVTNFIIEKNVVFSPRILTIGGTIDGTIIGEIYKKNIGDKSNPLEQRMRKTIIDVSKLDNSINRNIFSTRI